MPIVIDTSGSCAYAAERIRGAIEPGRADSVKFFGRAHEKLVGSVEGDHFTLSLISPTDRTSTSQLRPKLSGHLAGSGQGCVLECVLRAANLGIVLALSGFFAGIAFVVFVIGLYSSFGDIRLGGPLMLAAAALIALCVLMLALETAAVARNGSRLVERLTALVRS